MKTDTDKAAAPFSIARRGGRIEIVMRGSSIALSDTPENESLAALIVAAVNEREALQAVENAAWNMVWMRLGAQLTEQGYDTWQIWADEYRNNPKADRLLIAMIDTLTALAAIRNGGDK